MKYGRRSHWTEAKKPSDKQSQWNVAEVTLLNVFENKTINKQTIGRAVSSFPVVYSIAQHYTPHRNNSSIYDDRSS